MARTARPWPRPATKPVLEAQREWAAWLSGNVAHLSTVGGAIATTAGGTGLLGLLRRALGFWGSPQVDAGGQPKHKIHVPLAADIAAASRAMLFAQAPTFTADPPADTSTTEAGDLAPQYAQQVAATQAVLDGYREAGILRTLAGGAEACAGLGGVVFRATWDGRRRRVFVSRIDADNADLRFEHGLLMEATFTRTLTTVSASEVWRHIEIHMEVDLNHMGGDDDPDGLLPPVWHGIIRHQLWVGTDSDLGDQRPLDHHPDTFSLAPWITFDGDAIDTGGPGMAVVYIPNKDGMLWRGDHAGAYLGVPDIEGVEDLLDKLDALNSGLWREYDLAKARLVVPQEWLTQGAPGGGSRFDDGDVFVGVQTPATQNPADIVQLHQAAIRVDEYLRGMQQLVEDILRHAGYSAATFGEDETAANTATEVNSKNSRSRGTRQGKVELWQPELQRLLRKMLAVGVHLGYYDGLLVNPDLVSVTFPQPSQSPAELAATLATLRNARAISIELAVRTLHPEWKDPEVTAEVDRIRAEDDAPLTVVDGTDNPDQLPAEPVDPAVDPDATVDPNAPAAVQEQQVAGMDPLELKNRADAMGVLIRGGVANESAATAAGLPTVAFVPGARSTSVAIDEE